MLCPHLDMYSVKHQLEAVRERLERAAAKSGRTVNDVRIIAVTKYSGIGDGIIEDFIENGLTDFGESRPQELAEKAEYYVRQNVPIRWHQIGHLQRNKIRKILPVAALLHSIDSVKLAEDIDRITKEMNLPPVPCLLEIAISPDTTKQGFNITEVPEALETLATCDHIKISGLMGMASLKSNEAQTHREFESLRKLAETLKHRGLPENVSMTTLSMGMSGDFDIAVEEGATCVRLGSILYPN